MRKSTLIWIFFCTVVLIIFAIVSYKTLFGWWALKVLGIDYQTANWDPGGAYLGSGITLFSQRYTAWIGHPGITLMLLVQIIARSLYWLGSLSDTAVPFETYVAKNIFWIILIVKIVISLLYLFSAYLVYIFTLELIDKKEISLLAVISYLTTYPVLSYFNNISPEPLMIIFTLLAILFILKYKNYSYHYRDKNLKPFIYIGLSALSTACSLGTKMMFAIPLAFLIYLFIFLEAHDLTGKKIKFGFKRRIVDSSLYLSLLMIFLIPIYWKINLNKFFEFWFGYSPGAPSYASAENWGLNIFNNIGYLVANFFTSISKRGFSLLLPKFNYYGLFIIAESIFLVSSIFGIIMFWKKEPNKRAILKWLIAFNFLITLIYLYRTGWHYFMIQLAFLAIFFAYFIYSKINKIKNLSYKRKIMLSILVVLLSHSFSIFLFINSKISDMKEYRIWQPYYEALREINYNEKIGVINSPGFAMIFGNFLYYMPESSKVQFTKEFNNFFVDLDYKTAELYADRKSVRIIIYHTPQETILRRISQ